MTISVKVYTNSDDATIVWRTDKRIPDCRGFALPRQARDAAGRVTDSVVETWVGFENDPRARSGLHKPSTEWPIQRFLWSDYFARGAGEVRYRVVPMLGRAGSLQPAADSECSDWSPWVRVATGQTAGFSAYFNRGIVASQWVARAVANQSNTSTTTLGQDIKDPKSNVRKDLGGQLRVAMLDLLAQAKAHGEIIYAALFELNDPELIPALSALGKNCNLLLGSGAYKKGEPDENAAVRTELKKTGAINLYDRLVKNPHFAHNKFVVFCDAHGKPQRVWTGSTNWTVTGLCTQVNNGVLVQDPVIATAYFHRWSELKAAKSIYPETLAASGSKPGTGAVGNANITAWNAPVLKLVDLADARRLIQGARQGVLFLMFNPGPKGTLLNDILALNQQNLFVHGVVNTDPGGKKAPIFTLHDRGTPIDASPEVVLPAEIAVQMKGWFEKEFRYNMVMIHSKVVVIDPFGSHPVVMTGSHNLGPKASAKNDDNLMIIENTPGLAAEYAVNILGVYGHYKWRHNQKVAASGSASQKRQTQKWKGLQDNDTWQDGYYKAAKLREINFWFGTLTPPAPGTGSKRNQSKKTETTTKPKR